ncbi:hypothetical protein Golax_015165 [Gossypium laxum]|uniref:Uncharacterized protein n=1 Tax=Gossypium laxum TaxID=34288 RepID=A0A7J8ZYE4_9ROSI|nr:hypothetical protein [Gossypium laxum]
MIGQSFTTCSVEKTIVALVGTSIRVIKQPKNSDITISLIMTNLLPYIQKIELLGKMLK